MGPVPGSETQISRKKSLNLLIGVRIFLGFILVSFVCDPVAYTEFLIGFMPVCLGILGAPSGNTKFKVSEKDVECNLLKVAQ